LLIYDLSFGRLEKNALVSLKVLEATSSFKNFRLAITSFSNRWYALVWSGMAIVIL